MATHVFQMLGESQSVNVLSENVREVIGARDFGDIEAFVSYAFL